MTAMSCGTDKDLRRTHDQFTSPKTKKILSEAILGVPGATDSDEKRIVAQLGKRLREFKHLGKMKSFRPVAVTWVTRQAQLTIKLREVLQHTHSFNAPLLFDVLPTFDGEVSVDALRIWMECVKQHEAEAIATVPRWVRQFRRLVYKAIWSTLGGCLDLGVGAFNPVVVHSDGSVSALWHPVVEEIAGEVWLWVFQDAYDLATSSVPISVRLWHKARKQAIKWREERIGNLLTFVSQTTLDRQRQAVEKLMASADRTCLSEYESRMIERAESSDLDDMRQVDRVFECINPGYAESILDGGNDWEPVQVEAGDEKEEDSAGEGELEELPLAA